MSEGSNDLDELHVTHLGYFLAFIQTSSNFTFPEGAFQNSIKI